MATAKILQSPLVEEPTDIFETPEYTPEHLTYLKNLRTRLESAKNLREQMFPEFDDMTYQQYWQKNEDLANTKIKPKVNRQDVLYNSGTLRTKLFAFLSSLQGLNLSGDITAFDENDIPVNAIGNAMEDIVYKTDELDQDEEKKLLRQYEMLKHGTVFVEELWDDKYVIEKSPIENYDGKFFGVKIKSKKVKKTGRPIRNIISGLSVYLGDLSQYLISDQPFIFTAQTKRYDDAETVYGNFEMWKYVPKKARPFSGDTDKMSSMVNWRLFAPKENSVEIIKYQDKINKEYQILINGIPMLPPGFPFPWGHDEYNITQQNYRPIRHNFAYGKSFLFENKNPSQLLDEMMRLAILKTQKSLIPPYLNLSGRVISSKVLMPGTITMGIPPNTLVPVSPNEIQGVTNGEFNMMQELTRTLDLNTASQTFTGAREKGGQTTATQIVELQRQARIMLGVLIVSAALLEKKLIDLRLLSILKNWFNPLDQFVDEARNILKNKYRITSRSMNIEDEGQGIRIVAPMEELPTPEAIFKNEEMMKNQMGMPVRIIALNPNELNEAKYTWVVSVNPKEKKSSELSKLMFRAEVQDAMALGIPLNPQYVADRFAQVWEEDPTKMFLSKDQMPQPETPQQPVGGIPTVKSPKVQIPVKQGSGINSTLPGKIM